MKTSARVPSVVLTPSVVLENCVLEKIEDNRLPTNVLEMYMSETCAFHDRMAGPMACIRG